VSGPAGCSSGGVLLDITDNGVGISDQEMSHANWRLDNPPVCRRGRVPGGWACSWSAAWAAPARRSGSGLRLAQACGLTCA